MAETKNYYLGIEYSKDRIKCALLENNGQKYTITSVQTFESDNISSSLDALVKWKLDTLGPTNVKSIVSISESLIFLKELVIPIAKKDALDEAVYWELSSISPLPPTQAIYEWTPIEVGKDEQNVVAMAVRDTTISSISERLESGGIEVVAIEPSSISLTRIAGENYQKNTMLLLVGDKETDIVVLKSGKPVFSTTSDVPLKRSKDEKWRLSQAVADQIAKSTRDLINFWEEKNNSKIQQVLITGDLVDKYFGLAQSINDFAKIPVNIAKNKNITGLTYHDLPKAIINRYFIAIGAVIRFGGDVYAGVNLIQKEKRAKIAAEIADKIRMDRMTNLNYGLGFLLAGLLVLWVFLFTMKLTYSANIKKIAEMIQNHPAQELRAEFKNNNDYLTQINTLIGFQKDYGSTLRTISADTPREVKLTSLEYRTDKDKVWIVKGEGSREGVLAYYDRIKNTSGAKTVTMPYSNLNSDTTNKFEIDIIW